MTVSMDMSSSLTTPRPTALMVACAEENVVEVRELLASDEVRVNSTYDITHYSFLSDILVPVHSLA